MDFKEYQEKAHKTSQDTSIMDNKFLYPLLGLAGETGEIFEKFKKLFRDGDGKITEEFKSVIEKEMGDVLWYLAELSFQIGIDFDTIANKNIDKLMSRMERNKINGSGDDR